MNKLLVTAATGFAALPLVVSALPAQAAPATSGGIAASATASSTAGRAVAGHAGSAARGIASATQPVGVRAVTAAPSSAVNARLRHRRKRYNGTSTSVNWAGYAQTQAKGSVKSISGSFVVPTLATSPNGYASTWVGIDGWTDQWLVQTGVSEEVIRGRAYYYSWWEVITPTKVLPEQRFAVALRPGQRVTASVSIAKGTATMTMFNNQTGRSSTKSYAYAGPLGSAEWIQEDVYIGGRISPAPNWKQVTFMRLTRNSATPKLTYAQSMDIVDSSKVRETSTGVPSSLGNGFTVKWLTAGHWSNLS